MLMERVDLQPLQTNLIYIQILLKLCQLIFTTIWGLTS